MKHMNRIEPVLQDGEKEIIPNFHDESVFHHRDASDSLSLFQDLISQCKKENAVRPTATLLLRYAHSLHHDDPLFHFLCLTSVPAQPFDLLHIPSHLDSGCGSCRAQRGR